MHYEFSLIPPADARAKLAAYLGRIEEFVLEASREPFPATLLRFHMHHSHEADLLDGLGGLTYPGFPVSLGQIDFDGPEAPSVALVVRFRPNYSLNGLLGLLREECDPYTRPRQWRQPIGAPHLGGGRGVYSPDAPRIPLAYVDGRVAQRPDFDPYALESLSWDARSFVLSRRNALLERLEEVGRFPLEDRVTGRALTPPTRASWPSRPLSTPPCPGPAGAS